LHVVTLGHAGSGKSTIVGHILALTSEEHRRQADRNEKEGLDQGKRNVKFAWLLDTSRHERNRGGTVDLHTRKLETESLLITLTDTPGNPSYLKNTISGITAADVVLLVVDASRGVFENNLDGAGAESPTREHMLLAYAYGKKLLVAVTKMDEVGFEEERFQEVVAATRAALKRAKIPDKDVVFVPVCGLDLSAESGERGANLIEAAPGSMPWYSGPSLLAAVHQSRDVGRAEGLALRVPVQEVVLISGMGTVVCGKVEAGSLRAGSRLVFSPSGLSAVVRSVELYNSTVEQAGPGDCVAFTVPGLAVGDVKRGDVAMQCEDGSPAQTVVSLNATLSVRRPGGIKPGFCAVMSVHSAHVPVRFERLEAVLDKRTGEDAVVGPERLADKDVARVVLRPLCPLYAEQHTKELSILGRFTIRDQGHVVALGQIKGVSSEPVPVREGSLAKWQPGANIPAL